MARRTNDDDDYDDEFDDDDDDDEYDESDEEAEPLYATFDEWMEAYEDGLFDDYPYDEIDGGIDYSGE